MKQNDKTPRTMQEAFPGQVNLSITNKQKKIEISMIYLACLILLIGIIFI